MMIIKPLQPDINRDLLPVRRSGNYKPTIWDYDYIQSLNSVFTGEEYKGQLEKLVKNMRLMLEQVMGPLNQLKLIDDFQRLGISHHFEDAIDIILTNIYNNGARTNDGELRDDDLFVVPLEFRLLRQHGFLVSQDVFSKFKDEKGDFKPCLSTNSEVLLCLYEASYLGIEGETILDDVRGFATKHLSENLENNNIDELSAMEVRNALALPLHWRTPREKARWYIDIYAKKKDVNPILLQLAKLDFNMVQAIHQNDLKTMSRWWRRMALGEKLPFVRDRLMEFFYWGMGTIFKPEASNCRRMLTKLCALVTVVDDVYDVYGTLDELLLFTNVVERWDINLMEQLPEYMKICFLALFNSVNEMVYDVLKEHDTNVISYLKTMWANLCKAYLVEAKWYYNGHIPSLDEYLNTACITITGHLAFVHCYCVITKSIRIDDLEYIATFPSIIRWTSIILRLADDLGTSSDELKRGDVSKSIQCYMNDTGASEEEAREYMKKMIAETWKKVNGEQYKPSPFSKKLTETMLNLARMGQFVYQHGDGHGSSHGETKNNLISLFIQPILL